MRGTAAYRSSRSDGDRGCRAHIVGLARLRNHFACVGPQVTLNIGSVEGAAVGQKLLILKDGAGGGRDAVAEVEIVEVSDHQSRAKLSGEPKPISTGQRAIERS